MTSTNALFKVYIENMPDALNTKKDVDEYCKLFWKENKEKVKEAKEAEKAAKAAKAEKPKRKKGVDKDGNIKEKRAPSAYNIFVKDKYVEIKAENPNMDKTEIFAEIAKKWQESKQLNEEKKEEEEEEKEEDVKEEEEKEEDVKEEEVKEDEEVKALPKKKSGRKAIVMKKKAEVVEAENDE